MIGSEQLHFDVVKLLEQRLRLGLFARITIRPSQLAPRGEGMRVIGPKFPHQSVADRLVQRDGLGKSARLPVGHGQGVADVKRFQVVGSLVLLPQRRGAAAERRWPARIHLPPSG